MNDERIHEDIRREFKLTEEFKISTEDMDTIINNDGQYDLKGELTKFFMEVQKEFQNSVNKKVKDWYIDKTLEVGIQGLIGGATLSSGAIYGKKGLAAAIVAGQGIYNLFRKKR